MTTPIATPVMNAEPVFRFVKAFDREARTVRAILTYPETDYQADYLRPDGGDWSTYPSNPQVNWNHDAPIGRGRVVMKSVTVAGETVNVPVGTTTFFQREADLAGINLNRLDHKTNKPVGQYTAYECLDAAEQAARLVEDDIANGVSLEFSPLGPKGETWWPTGKKSLLEQRPAYHFDRWQGLGWAHTLVPVNPNARTLLPERIEKAIALVESGMIGNKPLSPIIMKSLAFAVCPKGASIVVPANVPVLKKDMANGYDAPGMGVADPLETPAVVEEAADALDPDAANTPPTAACAYDGAQAILDLCAKLEEGVKKAEHVKGRKKLMKLLEEVKTYVDDFNGIGEMIEADLAKADGDTPADDEGDDETEGEDKELETDNSPEPVIEKGLLICKSGYKPKRFAWSDLKPVVVAPVIAPTDDLDPVTEKSLRKKLVTLRKLKRQAGIA